MESNTNREDRNAIKEENKSEERIDRFLEISTTIIIGLSTLFLLFVIIATATDWLPWKINIAKMLGYWGLTLSRPNFLGAFVMLTKIRESEINFSLCCKTSSSRAY